MPVCRACSRTLVVRLAFAVLAGRGLAPLRPTEGGSSDGNAPIWHLAGENRKSLDQVQFKNDYSADSPPVTSDLKHNGCPMAANTGVMLLGLVVIILACAAILGGS
jgi:hypothetical protein